MDLFVKLGMVASMVFFLTLDKSYINKLRILGFLQALLLLALSIKGVI